MKTYLFALFISCSIPCLAQKNIAVDKLVEDGIKLHDKGDYNGAIKLYDDALLIDKDDYEANYEKAYSCQFAKRYDESIAICKYLLAQHADNSSIYDVYSNYGSVLDDKGEPEEAIKIFDEGIKKFPTFYLLHFNKGLTLARQKKWDAAEASFVLGLKSKPTHGGSLYYMALIQENSNKVAAIMNCLTFLALEPEGKRAEVIFKYVNELLQGYIAKGKDGKTSLVINTIGMEDKTKENNFSAVNMMMGIAARVVLMDSVKMKPLADKFTLQINGMAEALANEKKDGKGMYWDVYAPFFIDMQKDGMINTFAHIASITSGDADNIKWLNDNQGKMADFNKWLAAYQWNKKP